jgi:hypothetical protein
LIAPTDADGSQVADKMRCDASGNLIKDTHTQMGTTGNRIYDAENRMLTADGANGLLDRYTVELCLLLQPVSDENQEQPDGHEQNVRPPDGHSRRQVILPADGFKEHRQEREDQPDADAQRDADERS